MANALISRQRVVAVKSEGTPGTGEILANADGVMNCYDPVYTPEITMSERMSQGTYDADLTSIPGARTARLGFRTDLTGSGSALWFSRVMLHSGFTVSSLTATAVGSASTSTATVAAYIDGLKHQINGAVVTSFQIDFEAGQPMYIAVEYMGKYVAVSDTALLTPTYETTTPDRFSSQVIGVSFGGLDIPTFSGSLRIENAVAMRPDPNDITGYLHAQITKQTITASINAEAALEATRDDYAEWLAITTGTLIVRSEATTWTLPNAQRLNVQAGDTNGIFSRTLDFKHTGSTAATCLIAS